VSNSIGITYASHLKANGARCRHLQYLDRRRAMADILLWTMSAGLIALGLVGTVLPALPGTALVLGGILLGAWIDNFTRVGACDSGAHRGARGRGMGCSITSPR
jgi:hypothetical protein